MWADSRLIWLAVALLWTTTTCVSETVEASRWRWPDEPAPNHPVQPKRAGSGRVIPHSLEPPRLPHVKPLTNIIKAPIPTQEPAFLQAIKIPNIDAVVHRPKDPGPPLTLPVPVHQQPAAVSPAQQPASALPSVVEDKPETTDQQVPAGSKSSKNESSVPLLKDAGKPGNPYELLNKIFPPEERIRTKEEEEANLNALQNVDLGGLTPREVYLADDNLVVVRGFNFKKTYDPDPAGEPIDDYQAPAPRPPPPPEPGTVFYPSNDTGNFPLFPFPDFNSTNPGDLPFFPFVPGGLDQNNETGGNPGFQLPFPFLPPPPPPWDSEKEFNEIPQQFPGDFPPHFQAGQQGFPQQGGPPQQGFPQQGGLPPQQGFPQQGGLPPQQGFPQQGFPPGGPHSQGPLQFNGGPAPPPASGLPPRDGGNETLPQFPIFPFPPNATDDDDFIPFTPLFPERPVEYYYPSHVPIEVPPGPFGPGIFVPPPKEFFAPRDKSEKINVTIPEALFKPPFNLPNYYETKDDRARPAVVAGLPSVPPQHHQQRPSVPQEVGLQHLNYQPVPETTGRPQEIYFGIPPTLPPNVQLVHNQQSPVIIPHQLHEYGQRQPALPVIHSQPLLAHHQTSQGKPVTNVQNKVPQPAPAYYNQGYQVYPNKQYTSLESDIAVNYRYPLPEINPDSEIIDVSRPIPNQGKPTHGALQSYRGYAPVIAKPNHNTGLQRHHGQDRIVAEQPQIRPSYPIPASALQKADTPGYFVTVYRYGGGSYAYNLNGKR